MALALILLMLVALTREVASPAAIIVGTLVLFVLVGILPVEEAFLGFANPATITIAGLFIVAHTLRDHARVDALVERALSGAAGATRPALARLLPPVMVLSGVMNNTPLVATTAPVVRSWAQKHGVPATHLLIPLSFGAILGGLLTTIGTGPTLVVSGLMESAGHGAFGLFTITAAGAPLAALGGVAIVVLAPLLLPDRRAAHERIASAERDYTISLRVVTRGPADGATVAGAGLRDLETTYLATIWRGGREIAPVAPDLRLEGADELVFVGRVERVRDLLTHPGLVEAEQTQTSHLDGEGHALFEAVLGATSRLVGSTLKEAAFRGRYGGAVIAIHRAGERVEGKLGAVHLRAGDALLVLTDTAFADRWQASPDFAVIVRTEIDDGRDAGPYRWVTLGTLAGMVALAATGVLSIVHAVLLACSVLVGTRAIRFRQALDSLDRDVLLIVASAIGLGAAVERSGLAGAIGAAIGEIAADGGHLVALLAVVVGTLLLTELITNVAAAALMVPIALEVSSLVGAEPTGFAVAIALAASSSFLTPIGYQTNTIVYGLGGYRFGDYWRLGLPLAATTVLVSMVVVPAVWG